MCENNHIGECIGLPFKERVSFQINYLKFFYMPLIITVEW